MMRTISTPNGQSALSNGDEARLSASLLDIPHLEQVKGTYIQPNVGC